MEELAIPSSRQNVECASTLVATRMHPAALRKPAAAQKPTADMPPDTHILTPLFLRNFGGLVIGCIDSYDSEKRRIFQHFSRSTRFAFFCTFGIPSVKTTMKNHLENPDEQTSSKHRSNLKICRFFANFFAKISGFSRIFAKFC